MQAICPLFYLGFGSWNSHSTHFHQPKIRPKWDNAITGSIVSVSTPPFSTSVKDTNTFLHIQGDKLYYLK